MNILGFGYVNLSNLNFQRGNLFLSAHMWYRDIMWTVLFAPLLFLLSSTMVIRAKSNLCPSSQLSSCQLYSTQQVIIYNTLWSIAYVAGL
jgi:hypothetical protein